MLREFNDYLCEEIECRTNDVRDEKDRKTLNMLCFVLKKVDAWRLEKQKEQKSAEWSEEDEKLLNYAISLTDDAQVKRFLKSLKPQSHWKPGKEQTEVDLKKEVKEWVNLMAGASFPEQDGDFISEEDYRSVIRQTAYHFAEWGAKCKYSLHIQESCKENQDSFTKDKCIKCNEYGKGYKYGYDEGLTIGYNKGVKETLADLEKEWKHGYDFAKKEMKYPGDEDKADL